MRKLKVLSIIGLILSIIGLFYLLALPGITMQKYCPASSGCWSLYRDYKYPNYYFNLIISVIAIVGFGIILKRSSNISYKAMEK